MGANDIKKLQALEERILAQENSLGAQANRIAENALQNLNQLDLLRKMLLRSEALPRPEKLPQPTEMEPDKVIESYSIGYSCNLLNNNYLFSTIARKQGLEARVFLDPKFSDQTVTAHPAWEEVFFQAEAIPGRLDELPAWETPAFVRTALWDNALLSRVTQAFEYDTLKTLLEGTSVKVTDAFSYLLAYTVLPHRDLLRLFHSVDLLQVSGSHIGLASFSDTPYVTFPFGGDLYSLPFDDNELGWMQARGFRKASRHIASGRLMVDYLKALGVPESKIDLIPFMVDTDRYAPLPSNPLRETLRRKYPGKTLILVGARQNWAWKGNDKFYRALASLGQALDQVQVLTVWYGQDTDKTEALLRSLDLADRVEKIGVLSKEAIRQYVDAVDLCVDQFTLGSLGTFALESMSCATPVVGYYDPEKHFAFEEEPPLLNAFSETEIAGRLAFALEHRDSLAELGRKNRDWIKRFHGHEALWPRYDAVYRRALINAKYNL